MFTHKPSLLTHPDKFYTLALKQSHQMVLLSLCTEVDLDIFLDMCCAPLIDVIYVYDHKSHRLINIHVGCLNSTQVELFKIS